MTAAYMVVDEFRYTRDPVKGWARSGVLVHVADLSRHKLNSQPVFAVGGRFVLAAPIERGDYVVIRDPSGVESLCSPDGRPLETAEGYLGEVPAGLQRRSFRLSLPDAL